MKLVMMLSVFIFSSYLFASEDHAAPADSSRLGAGKAVEAFNEEDGFKLSQKAMTSLGVQFQELKGSSPWRIPRSAVVQVKQSQGVYRKYNEWISMVLIKVVKTENEFVHVSSSDLESGDRVAIQGVSYLRMTDADLNSGTVDNCAH